MIHPYLKIDRSTIGGKGLIAYKKISRGTVMWIREVNIRSYTPLQVKNFSLRYRTILNKYSYREKEMIYYSPSESKYFNHSCNANTLPLPGDPEMDIAIRDIARGEEATYEYGFLLDDKERFMCFCHAVNCRKVISKIVPGSKLERNISSLALKAHKYDFNKVSQPVIESKCYCGADKKFKECGLLNAQEHRLNMIKLTH